MTGGNQYPTQVPDPSVVVTPDLTYDPYLDKFIDTLDKDRRLRLRKDESSLAQELGRGYWHSDDEDLSDVDPDEVRLNKRNVHMWGAQLRAIDRD